MVVYVLFAKKKRNYVDICLAAVESEYRKASSYHKLCLTRINSLLRYQTSADSKDDNHEILVVDEAMEKIRNHGLFTHQTLLLLRNASTLRRMSPFRVVLILRMIKLLENPPMHLDQIMCHLGLKLKECACVNPSKNNLETIFLIGKLAHNVFMHVSKI